MVSWIGNVLFYVFALIWLGSGARFRGLLRSFIPVGQMPLTVYLMQSVIATSILYGYGLGLTDQVGPAEGILLTVGILACCMIFSRVWFRFFALGPMEWLWALAAIDVRPRGSAPYCPQRTVSNEEFTSSDANSDANKPFFLAACRRLRMLTPLSLQA
ncbi:DUF418 domain-containing protein [Candidatus Acetothermia bacterium]|jgi:uncharacterized membrane protein YeiB|nr:DUF418 domain-containing protein [Candidatus Acetothermia bacterium]